MQVRFFVSQEALDALVDSGVASIDVDSLSVVPRRLKAHVTPAIYVSKEIEGKGDPNQIVGKVKSLDAVTAMKADHYRDSLIVGDTAYEVVEGYLGEAPEGWLWPNGGGPAVSKVPPPPAAKEPEKQSEADAMEQVILNAVTEKRGGRSRKG